jgi:hypothetical protein
LRVAEAYLRERRLRVPCRVDVVAVEFPPHGSEPRVELIRNAVQGTKRKRKRLLPILVMRVG